MRSKWIAVALLAGCADEVAMEGPAEVSASFETANLAQTYPDLEALWNGDFGIYRSCGPNNGVCHNSKQYPDLRTMGSFLEHVGRPCNALRESAAEIHDWCESSGDALRAGDTAVEIGHFEPLDEGERTWLIHLRDEAPELRGEVTIARQVGDEWRPLYRFVNMRGTLTAAESDEGTPAVRLELLAEEFDGEGYAARLAQAFRDAGVPGNSASIQLGDPNGNGIFGGELGAALIMPGHPDRSYLLRRLTDPEFGAIMPLANCCSWTRESLRALWCWIAGLDDDASNALAPIDYASCPDGPIATLTYPTPGPMCASQGLCPVSAVDPLAAGPTWTGVEAILRRSCSGSECHVGGSDPDNPFRIPYDEDGAFEAVLSRLEPGSPNASLLYQRIDPAQCIPPECAPMPLDGPSLPVEERQLIRDWIAAGAPRD